MAQTESHHTVDQRFEWERTVRGYYAIPFVRDRIREFLGATCENGSSAVYINANDASQNHRTPALDPSELDRCLNERKEIYRSLWDRRHLVANLDIEYVNLDRPGLPYQELGPTDALLHPVVNVIEDVLNQSGIHPLIVLSGRGYHYTWNIPQDSQGYSQLAELGHVSPSLKGKYAGVHSSRGDTIGQPLSLAFSGLSLVLEHLTHEVFRQAKHRLLIPLTIGAVEVLSGRNLRESVSIDLTEYADPLHTRAVRVPFSVYYKPLQQEYMIGQEALSDIPPLFLLPVTGIHHSRRGLERLRDVEEAVQMTQETTARIPEQSDGTTALIRNYRASYLAGIHDWFYSQEHDSPDRWRQSYDATDFRLLPPSAQTILREPNDLLLKPACLRHIVRIFLALGWHPRHIAGLVRSKYERDHGWGEQWYIYDAATRADFFCRVFTGLILCGIDDLSDFYCPPVGVLRGQAKKWNENFEPFKESLKRRIQNDRLASRPFHGLFL